MEADVEKELAAKRKAIDAKPPENLVAMAHDGEILKVSWGNRTIAILPGQSALGRTYEEWAEIARKRRI